MHVIVTGSSGGLGKVLCEYFLSGDYAVTGISRSIGTMAQTTSFLPIAADLTDQAETLAAFNTAISSFGVPQLVIAAAGGIGSAELIKDAPVSSLRAMLAINLETSYNTVQAALRIMNQGAIVTIAAQSALELPPARGCYAVANAAVIALTNLAANETAGTGISLNVLAPHIIDTPANREWGAAEEYRNWVSPLSVAKIAEFLASEAGREISGTVIRLPGGSQIIKTAE